MRLLIPVTAAIIATAPAAAQGKFTGALEFTEKGCERQGRCILKHSFGYIDPEGLGWEAKAGNVTDGASIPPPFHDSVGRPFDADLVRAAVIHDHYCDRHVRSTWATHWVFHEALITSGVSSHRAGLMYAAVLAGGPKWIWVIEGEPCQTGQSCIQEAERPSLLPQLRKEIRKGGKETKQAARTLLTRPPRYHEASFLREMAQIQKVLAERKGPVKRAEMEALVKGLRPDDPFINAPDVILRRQRGGAVK